MKEYIEPGIAVVVAVLALILHPVVGGIVILGVLAQRSFKAYLERHSEDRLAKLESEVKQLHLIVGIKNTFK